jgi:hypothetical protein
MTSTDPLTRWTGFSRVPSSAAQFANFDSPSNASRRLPLTVREQAGAGEPPRVQQRIVIRAVRL